MAEPTITWKKITLRLRSPFGVSYGTSETRDAFRVRCGEDEGWGEGTIPPYYGIPPEAMTAYWDDASLRGRRFPDEVEEISGWLGSGGPAPARCGLSLALHDRIGRRNGLPLYRLLDIPAPSPLATSYTIGLDTPEAMARLAREAGAFAILKIKLGADDDLPRFMAVREARPDAEILVDANAGWTRERAVENVRFMQDQGLVLVEQPVAKEDLDGLGWVQSRVNVPVVADESLQRLADVGRLAAAGVQAVNVKLMKIGGPDEALTVIRHARKLGLRIMLGCMIETSLGVTAMAHFAGLAEWLDLDAPMLIGNDPFQGVTYDAAGRISVPDRPGIGVILRDPQPS